MLWLACIPYMISHILTHTRHLGECVKTTIECSFAICTISFRFYRVVFFSSSQTIYCCRFNIKIFIKVTVSSSIHFSLFFFFLFFFIENMWFILVHTTNSRTKCAAFSIWVWTLELNGSAKEKNMLPLNNDWRSSEETVDTLWDYCVCLNKLNQRFQNCFH